MRDVSKVFQGISLGDKVGINSNTTLIKLWMHECTRVFCDRLVNTDDTATFSTLIETILQKHYSFSVERLVESQPLLFGQFVPQMIGDKLTKDK